MFELRRDPIVGRQVLIAEDRAGRPSDFVELGKTDDGSAEGSPDDCPFCAGHESMTPAPLLEVVGPSVAGQSKPWQVRVVPNKYPAVSFEARGQVGAGVSALASRPLLPVGSHEVIVESPRHVSDITELSVAEFATVLQTYCDRLIHWSADSRVQYCSIFKNVGVAAGASLEHVHSQLVALPETPPVVAAELECSERYFQANKACIFCQLIDEELTHRQRLVCEDESFVAFCAFAGRQPFETWILPRSHQAGFEQLSDAGAEQLAAILIQLVQSLQTQLPRLSYNLILHTGPFRPNAAEHYHWHFELVPRSTELAGFEWGTGMHINPLSPERAAARLCQANS